jgi:predicted DNA-binding transcriptional regulator AlpA
MKTAATRGMLTIPEVCAELRISRSTFYEWRAKRTAPPCIKLPNNGLRVLRADLDAWLSGCGDAA